MNSGRIPQARSVGGAVLLTLACVNTLLLSLFGIADFLETRHRLENTLQTALTDLAGQLAGNLDAPLWYMERETVARIVEGAMQDRQVAAVLVTDRGTGRVSLGRSRDRAWRIVPAERLPAPDGGIGTERDIVFDGKPIGTVAVVMTGRFATRALYVSLGRIVVRIFLLNLALAAALAVVLRRRIIRPLASLEAYAARICSDGDALPMASGGDLPGELGSLGRAMEAMVDRLRSAQRQYQGLFENATEGVFQTSLDGRITSANKALARMLGFASAQALVLSVEDVGSQVFYDPGDRRRMLERLQAEGSVAGFQTRFTRQDQQLLWVLLNARLVRDELGNPVFVEGTVTDVTARVRAERRLEKLNHHLREAVRERTERLAIKAAQLEAANERLKELDRLKSGFLSTVSHDLRTPLTSIMGFAKLISRDFSKFFLPFAAEDGRLGRQAERLVSNLAIIESEGARLTRLINDFLDLSKIESGRAEWRDTPVDAAKVIRQAVAAVSGDFEAKPEVFLVMDVPAELPELRMDQDRLSQVMVNLLGNAAKFTDRGTVRVWAGAAEETLRVEVSDTGQGVPPEALEKIFDKFHQAEAGDTVDEGRRRKGTGLGLAICRQIVEHYRGRIWAESELGKGSRFILELPVASAAPMA